MDRLPDSVAAPMAEPAHRTLCTDCGISRSSDPQRCGRACQFIQPDYAGLESRVHGRARDPSRGDEQHFGPLRRMLRASLRQPSEGAQWSGITTRIAERLLETTRLPVDEVARRVGYAEPSTLRRLIRREARRSPAELRRPG